jgi:NADP-dependent 3-hydroxy acid dehydrogenase YdfG
MNEETKVIDVNLTGMIRTAAGVIPQMPKGNIKPFMMSVEKAVAHIERCIRIKPVCYTAPKVAIPLVKFRN